MKSSSLSRYLLPRPLAAVPLLVGLSACGATQKPVGVLCSINEAPVWVKDRCSAYWDEGASMICAVGSAEPYEGSDPSDVLRDSRHFAQIAVGQVVDLLVQSYVENESCSCRADGDGFRESVVREIGRTVSEASLAGVQQYEVYEHCDGTIFTLMAIDSNRLRETINSLNGVNYQIRQGLARQLESARELEEGAVDPD